MAVEAKLELDEESYVESFRPHLMDVVHAWCSVSTLPPTFPFTVSSLVMYFFVSCLSVYFVIVSGCSIFSDM